MYIYMMFYIIVIWPIHHYSVILLIIKSYSASVRNLSNHVNLVSYVFQFIATIVFLQEPVLKPSSSMRRNDNWRWIEGISDWEDWWHGFWIRKDAHRGLSHWEETSSSTIGTETRKGRWCWLELVGSTNSGVDRLTLSTFVAHNVMKEKTTANLMATLSGMYEKPWMNNNVHLTKKLNQFKDDRWYACCATPEWF